MSRVFEDELMDLHADCISLCLEVVHDKADKIFAYCSIEKDSNMFNAFFEVNDEIKTLGQLGISRAMTMQFLQLGTQDLEKYEELGKQYDRPIPTEIKMVYDMRTKKLDTQYRYDEVCGASSDVCAEDVFMTWLKEIKEGNGTL